MKRYHLLSMLSMMLFAVIAVNAKEVKCVCNDTSSVLLDCGICGLYAGSLEKTDDGVKCFCEGNIFFKEITCPEVCKKKGGWTGKMK